MFTAHVIDWQGQMLGRYRLQRLLGRGGMGEVWQATDTELDRQVAIKLLPPVVRQEEDYLRAFAAEARLIASLEHPHILAVHDFGEFQLGDEVITYLIMPLVDGTLRDRIKQSDDILPITVSLNYLRQAAQAIDYAHNRHILHRDIKPANILLQADWLFLADFGIAKLLSTSTYRSRTHAGAGTPGYMAPEQIRGKAEPASDLYSLTVVAYKLLTNHLPFSGNEAYEVFLKHLREEPLPPRQFNAQLPEVMERTLLKSLARMPAERHTSCLAFVAELEQGWCTHGIHTPASSDPDGTLITPWNKRAQASFVPTQYNNGVPTFSTPLMETILPNMGSSMTPTQPAELSSLNKTKSEAASVSAKTSGTTRRALLLGSAALLITGGGVALASFLPPDLHTTQKINAGIPLLKLIGHTQEVANVRWNPHGRYLASGGYDAKMLLWDIDTLLTTSNGKLRSVEQPTARYDTAESLGSNNLGWSPDGHSLLTITTRLGQGLSRDLANSIETIDIFTPGAHPVLYYDTAINDTFAALAWSSSSNTIATSVVQDIKVVLWKPGQTRLASETLQDTTRSAAQKQQDTDVSLLALCWSQDGTWLIGLDTRFYISLWNVTTKKMLRIALPDRTLSLPAAVRKQPNIYRYNVTASPTNPSLLAASDNDVAAIYDIQKNKFIYLMSTDDPVVHQSVGGSTPYYAQITGLAWSPDGRYLAGGYLSSKKIYIWDLQNPRPTLKNGLRMPDLTFGGTNGHTDSILDLAWSPDGRYLASSSLDTSIIIWSLNRT